MSIYSLVGCIFMRNIRVSICSHWLNLFISSKNRRLKPVVALCLNIASKSSPCHSEKHVVNGMNRPRQFLSRKIPSKNRILYKEKSTMQICDRYSQSSASRALLKLKQNGRRSQCTENRSTERQDTLILYPPPPPPPTTKTSLARIRP